MTNRDNNKKTGSLGEDLACRFLVKQGFTITDRNYLKKCGEIDIIGLKGGIIHFVEVKAVSCETLPDSRRGGLNDSFRPEDNVHPRKLQRLAKTIQVYLTEKRVSDETDWQLDVITVYIDKIRLISRISILENIII